MCKVCAPNLRKDTMHLYFLNIYKTMETAVLLAHSHAPLAPNHKMESKHQLNHTKLVLSLGVFASVGDVKVIPQRVVLVLPYSGQ